MSPGFDSISPRRVKTPRGLCVSWRKIFMQLVHCDESHSEAILGILNETILSSTAIHDYRPRPLESMRPWFAAGRHGNYPVIGALSAAGELLGSASYGLFRGWPAYKYSVEHSVYVAAASRGRGIGRRLRGNRRGGRTRITIC